MSDPSVPQVDPTHKRTPFYQPPGHPIAYYPSLVPVAGSVKAAVLLCQLLYWTPRAKDATAWIYKSQHEIMAETGMSLKEQRQARVELKRRHLLQEHYDRLDHQLWFRVNVEAYNAAILLISDQVPKGHFETSPKGTSGSDETAHGEVPFGDVAKDLPETMTEITVSETSPEISSNVGANVGTDRKPHKRQIRLTPRQQRLVEELENQFDTHSRGAFCTIASDHGLGEDVAYRLMRETLELEAAGRIKTSASQCFMDLCLREAERQGIDLGFRRT
jgi:hypothetical protein